MSDRFWRGTDYGVTVLQMIYQADQPTRLFPSIHCLVSWFCYIGIRGRSNVQRLPDIFLSVCDFSLCLYADDQTALYRGCIRRDFSGGGTYWLAIHTQLYRYPERLFDAASQKLFVQTEKILGEGEGRDKQKEKDRKHCFSCLCFTDGLQVAFRGEDLHEVVREIMRVNPWYLLPRECSVLCFYHGVSPLLFITCLERWIFLRKMDLFSVFMCWDSFSCLTAVCEGDNPCRSIICESIKYRFLFPRWC